MANSKAAALASAVITSQDVEGVAVYNGHGKKIGTVDHLKIEKVTGRVLAVVVRGAGFFGLGHAHYEVPWEELKYSLGRNAFEVQGIPDPT